MGGSNKTKQQTKDQQNTSATTNQNTTQAQNSSFNTTGNSAFGTTGTSQANPYGPATGLINSILGQAGNIQAPDLSGIGAGIQGAIPGLFSGYNPATQGITDAATYAARNAVSSNAAAAGRDLTSPGYASSIATNIANTLAPYQYQNYQQGLSQIPALTQTAAGLPYSGSFNLENLILPIAQAFGSTNQAAAGTGTQSSSGTSSTTGTGSLQGQTTGQSNGISNTTVTQPTNPLMTGLSIPLGILGLLSQGNSGGLGGALGSALGGLL